MVDRDGRTISQGEEVRFYPYKGGSKPARVISTAPLGKMVEVEIANDPFTSYVEYSRLAKINKKGQHRVPAATAKELRRKAKELGISGWEEMDRNELSEAINSQNGSDDEEERTTPRMKKAKESAKKSGGKATKASKSTKKAAKATKATASKKTTAKKSAASSNGEGGNPFREGSNLWLMTEELMKGGKRSSMVSRLRKKIELNPRAKAGSDFDVDAEIDYRLVRVCQTLTNEYGFTIEKDGRGPEQVVKAVPPS